MWLGTLEPPTLATPKRVALFVTCLVDAFRPSVGMATVQLLEDAGCEVVVPAGQTCCGQPGYNSGDRAAATNIARRVIEMLEPFEWVVVPSGSCGGMIRKHYPDLFAGDEAWAARAKRVAGKTYELTAFLTHVLGVKSVSAQFPAKATYHDSCSALRELGLRSEPRLLLNSVTGLTLTELKERDACCGFGGTFAVKYPDISNAIVEKKTADVAGTGADLLISADMGCLLNMAGKLKREKSSVQVRHVAEVLAGMVDLPAIGEGRTS
jgi:L-lactate dehydrogenase complex protein LldE